MSCFGDIAVVSVPLRCVASVSYEGVGKKVQSFSGALVVGCIWLVVNAIQIS